MEMLEVNKRPEVLKPIRSCTSRYGLYRMLTLCCASAQDASGGRETRSSVHQSLQLPHLLHQPRVRRQRRHLPVSVLCRLHPNRKHCDRLKHLSGNYLMTHIIMYLIFLNVNVKSCIFSVYSLSTRWLWSCFICCWLAQCIRTVLLYVSLLFLCTEPHSMCLYIHGEFTSHSCSWKMSNAGLPGGFPHLPVYDLCLQPGGSDGPDSLCHRSHQVCLFVWGKGFCDCARSLPSLSVFPKDRKPWTEIICTWRLVSSAATSR